MSTEPGPPSGTYGYAEFGVTPENSKSIGERVEAIGKLGDEIKVRKLTSVAPGFRPVTDAASIGTRLWLFENGIRYEATSPEEGSANARGFVPWLSIFAIRTRGRPSFFHRDRQEMQIQYRLGPDLNAVLAMMLKRLPLSQFLQYASPRLRPETKIATFYK